MHGIRVPKQMARVLLTGGATIQAHRKHRSTTSVAQGSPTIVISLLKFRRRLYKVIVEEWSSATIVTAANCTSLKCARMEATFSLAILILREIMSRIWQVVLRKLLQPG